MIPDWFQFLSIACLVLGFACAAIVLVDVLRDPQHMWIMNVVWPVICLFSLFAGVWAYYRYGKLAARSRVGPAMERGEEMPNRTLTPFPVMVGKGALHCGAGCTLGDICAEWLAFGFPAIATALGYGSIFPEKIFAVWVFDYFLAYLFGIAFQYFTIAPMRGLPPGKGIVQAIKADTLSLTAWQAGMYGFMAVAYFVIFKMGFGMKLETDTVGFWFMMQVAMICGFATSYPVNWWLIGGGVKEKM